MKIFTITPRARVKPGHAVLAVAVLLGLVGLGLAILPRAISLPGL